MTLEQSAREQFELLQYVAFFGALVLLMAAEALIPLHDKSPQRVLRWPTNFGLTAINILILSAVPVGALGAADWAAAKGFGLLPYLGIAGAVAATLGILGRSFTNYLVHAAMHKVPILWRIHRVHHSDGFIDVSTTVRFHPLEFLVQMPIALAVIVALGIPPIAIIIYEIADAAMAIFTHANTKLPRAIERPIGYVLVTPSMHRIHHSSEPAETDSNYGATLSIWDRLLGTFCEKSPEAVTNMEIGLKECQDARSRSFPWLLKLPFIRLLALGRERSNHD